MKKFIASLSVFVLLTGAITAHVMWAQNFGKNLSAVAEEVENAACRDDWQKARENLDELSKLWEKNKLWAAATVRTNIIDEIDIGIEQSKAYAEIKQKPDFMGEFIMLRKLLEYIPRQEGLSAEELL